MKGHFNDALAFDKQNKTAVSFRDGVLRYLGSELGLEPADREFTVYRSPATIANAAARMAGVPLTDEHVSMDAPPAQPVGTVETSDLIDMFDEQNESTVGVRNSITVSDLISAALETGKRQLSLGYDADLVPHVKYDFEQRNIGPHHLAVVQAGRCGPACAFLDRKPTTTDEDQPMSKLLKAFLDAEGAPNLEQIVEIAQGLPEALRKLPMDKLTEVMPQLQEIIAIAGGANGSDEVDEPEEMEVEDMDGEPEEVEDEKPKSYADSTEFKDAVAEAVKSHAAVVDKARDFLDNGYAFAGKSKEQIMRDALATEHGETQFTDAELPVAFKLLKAQGSNLKNFGDGAADAQQGRFTQHADKEI